jgi:hypothetical protein
MPIVIKAVSAEDYKIWLEGAKEEFATGPIAPSAVELASVE